jgi:RalA-binding protein 1
MTMRNVGIVFSPTLGIPAGVFSLMLGEFNRVFNVDGINEDSQDQSDSSSAAQDANRRNSRQYTDAAADQLLGLSGRTLTCDCLIIVSSWKDANLRSL